MNRVGFLVGSRAAAIACAILTAPFAVAQQGDLFDLSLDELLQVPIALASRQEEQLFRTAAAVTVITEEDIRRSTATHVAELLRMVPGFQVGRTDSSRWAVSCRGFANQFSNKLLVLVDGRSVYTPLFAGVYWDAQDIPLEDIERIEIVRGPGAALWGANAVNGIINIVTKSAADSHGGLLVAGGGTEERALGTIRYGGALGSASYRVIARYMARDSFVRDDGGQGSDDWSTFRLGFRADWEPVTGDTFTFQGEAIRADTNGDVRLSTPEPPYERQATDPQEASGGSVQGRFTRVFSASSDLALQLYYDAGNAESRFGFLEGDAADIDFQHRLGGGRRQEQTWGLGYRSSWIDSQGTFNLRLEPESQQDNLFSSFVQDRFSFLDDALHLTLGTKIEHNEYTGLEVQPSVKLIWTRQARLAIWGSVSRAVRTPSVTERYLRINALVVPSEQGLTYFSILGDEGVSSERLMAYEVGARGQPHERLTVDAAAYYFDYDDLRTVRVGEPFEEAEPPPAHTVIPFRADNSFEARSLGAELAVNWQAAARWKVVLGYAWIDEEQGEPGPLVETDPTFETLVRGDTPRSQAHLRSLLSLPGDLDLDAAVYYVSRLHVQDIPAYVRLDIRAAWRPTEKLELSLSGQNLLEEDHQEFGDALTGALARRVERGVYAKVALSF